MQITGENSDQHLSDEEITWRLAEVNGAVDSIVTVNWWLGGLVIPAVAADVIASALKSEKSGGDDKCRAGVETARNFVMFLLLSLFLNAASAWLAKSFKGQFHTAIRVFKSRRVDSGHVAIGLSVASTFVAGVFFLVSMILLMEITSVVLACHGAQTIVILIAGIVVMVGTLGYFLMVMLGKIYLGCYGKTGIFAGLDGRYPCNSAIGRAVGAEIVRRLSQVKSHVVAGRRLSQDDLPTHHTAAASSSSSNTPPNAAPGSSSSNTSSSSSHVLSTLVKGMKRSGRMPLHER